jgi:hypothetical protein
MGWVIVALLLIAFAFGVLGAVIKATVFVVLTTFLSVVCLVAIAGWLIRRRAERWSREIERRLNP